LQTGEEKRVSVGTLEKILKTTRERYKVSLYCTGGLEISCMLIIAVVLLGVTAFLFKIYLKLLYTNRENFI